MGTRERGKLGALFVLRVDEGILIWYWPELDWTVSSIDLLFFETFL